MDESPRTTARLAFPVLIATADGALVRETDGKVARLSRREAARVARETPPLVCHMPAVARRLGSGVFAALDILELYAFVRPARFCTPTPAGVSRALGLDCPPGHDGEAEALQEAAAALLAEIEADRDLDAEAGEMARLMAAGGWPWGAYVLAALGIEPGPAAHGIKALETWRDLPEWAEEAPEPAPSHASVTEAEARARLAQLVGEAGEARPQQGDYAAAVTAAFAPREDSGQPQIVLAEAGTGTGKTLGYVAPASLWAEKNRGAVWISTYTRNLQRQIDQELNRLYPDATAKAAKAVVRKGRENYLCLLNFEDAVSRAALDPREAAALGLVARWIAASRDGDMVGGDFPAWLTGLLGAPRTTGLTDRRGECIYAGCAHYHKCFIERTVRRARRAEIVIANHALVMTQAALSGLDDANVPTRYVFDEGHHLFAAADSAFSAHLTGAEAAELRRWIAGAEDRRRSRARGLSRRIGDIAATDGEAEEALDATLRATRRLPGAGWLGRLAEGNPKGPAERFLGLLRSQVLARAPRADEGYSLEADAKPAAEGVLEAAAALENALAGIAVPLINLTKRLHHLLQARADTLETSQRLRIEGSLRAIERRALNPLAAWRAMLAALAEETPEDFVDWFGVTRAQGREVDAGMHRHWIDPTKPFADAVLAEAHGVTVTSATLMGTSGDAAADWAVAEARTGAQHLPKGAANISVPSPFDYAAQSRVFIVTDVAKEDGAAVAAAYRELFKAANGGALGLFTSIARLRSVHDRMAAPLDSAGIPLYAQHIDAIDTPTLIDIFREEIDSCLLGTDAVRDGVDVPGRALRLIVFDRVPWPRPDILHRARRAAFGGRGYDEMITRLRLEQAFGRLIRTAHDRGCFVMLDRSTPSRLLSAFPDGVAVERVGLADAVAGVSTFLGAP